MQYGYVNPTLWMNPASAAAEWDGYAWSNGEELYYGCGSRRGGLLGSLRKDWRKAGLAIVAAAVALLCVYPAACSAFRNAQTEDLHRRYKQGYPGPTTNNTPMCYKDKKPPNIASNLVCVNQRARARGTGTPTPQQKNKKHTYIDINIYGISMMAGDEYYPT